ncbi:MAG: hypothetical protein V7750_12400 [Sneathiella sp.]
MMLKDYFSTLVSQGLLLFVGTLVLFVLIGGLEEKMGVAHSVFDDEITKFERN